MLCLERFVLALVYGGLPVGSSTLLACASKTGAFGFAAPVPPGNPGLWLKLLKSGKPALHDHSGNLKICKKYLLEAAADHSSLDNKSSLNHGQRECSLVFRAFR